MNHSYSPQRRPDAALRMDYHHGRRIDDTTEGTMNGYPWKEPRSTTKTQNSKHDQKSTSSNVHYLLVFYSLDSKANNHLYYKDKMVMNPNYDSDSEEEWEVLGGEEQQMMSQNETEEEANNMVTANPSTRSSQEQQGAATMQQEEIRQPEVQQETAMLAPDIPMVENAENELHLKISDDSPNEQEPLLDDTSHLAETPPAAGSTTEKAVPEHQNDDENNESETTPNEVAESNDEDPLLVSTKNTQHIDSFKSMGFAEADARHALQISGCNVEQAVEWLLTNATSHEQQPASSSSSARQPRQDGSSDGSWLGSSLKKIVNDIDQKHHIRRKARNSVKTVGSSMRNVRDNIKEETKEIGTAIGTESQRLSKRIQETADEINESLVKKLKDADIPSKAQAVEDKAKDAAQVLETRAKQMGESIQTSAKTIGLKAKDLNKDGKVTNILTAAAVIGAGILFAKGKPGAGAAVVATGGAAYMASEAARQPYRHDSGLNEGLHME